MIVERSNHAAASIGRKMFVIGGNQTTSCEVFDSCSRKFTIIESGLKIHEIKRSYFDAVCIGDSLVIFHNFYSKKSETIFYMYNVVEKKRSNVKHDFTKKLFASRYLKYHF